jgi:hypothetical protein
MSRFPVPTRGRACLPRRGEDGYAMVVAVTVSMIITVLLTVMLAQGLHNNQASDRAAQRDASFDVAEAGINWSISKLESTDRAAVASGAVQQVPTPDGQAEVRITAGRPGDPAGNPTTGYYTVEALGKVTTKTGAPTRHIRVVLGPAPSFRFALYADEKLTVDADTCIVGSIYGGSDIVTGNNTTVAGTASINGSVISRNGDITFHPANNPRCPASVTVNGSSEPVDTSHDIANDVLAPGTKTLNGASYGGRLGSTPPQYTMPQFTFDPQNYANLVAYGTYGTPPNPATAEARLAGAAAAFNAASGSGDHDVAGGGTGLAGTYVVWDANPNQANVLSLDRLKVRGDTVIYTNAPVDFGNTQTVSPQVAGSTPLFAVISTYAPLGSQCTNGTGASDCGISGKNQVFFDPAIAVLLYTKGGIAFKNACNGGGCNQQNSGAYYANAIIVKNNFNLTYNQRISNLVGFGAAALQQLSWQELPPCQGLAAC